MVFKLPRLSCSAADHIRNGDADLMLAGGADAAIIPSGIGGFIACRALSQRNEDPARASRPWDRNRDGFVMGEGAGAAAGNPVGKAHTKTPMDTQQLHGWGEAASAAADSVGF